MLANFAFIATILAAAYGIGTALDDATRPEVRQLAYQWLTALNFSRDYSKDVHLRILNTFEDIFTENPVSRVFVLRSVVFSIFGYLICGLLLCIAALMYTQLPLLPALQETLTSPLSLIAAIGLSFAAISISDYLCLAKTLLVIQSRHFKFSPWRHFLLDLAISSLIAITWSYFGIMLVDSIGSEFEFLQIINIRPILAFSLVTSAFPTCASLALAAGATAARVLSKTGIPFELAKRKILDIEKRPFSSAALLLWPFIGIIAAALLPNAT